MLIWTLAGVVLLGIALVAYGVFIERTWFRLRRYRLEILPSDVPPLSILHLSDLHFLRRDRKKRRFLGKLPRADVTVVTGDLLGESDAVDAVVETLRPLRGRVASYVVLGANDYFAPKPFNYLRYFVKRDALRRRWVARNPWRDLIERLEADGWQHLKNRRTELSLDGTRIEVAGLDDPHIHRQDSRVYPREWPDRFGVAVVHAPDPAPELAAFGYGLIVSGHTHGGQVRFPLIGAVVTNSTLPRRFARGLVRLGDAYLHVSGGMGTSKYAPFRFLCRPEASLLELAPGGAQPAAFETTSSKTRA